MVVVGVVGVIALAWLAAGLALIAVPRWWSTLIGNAVSDPSRRFAVTQVMILVGLVLLAGASSLHTTWLWAALGILTVLKGMFFLGAPEPLRMGLVEWWSRTPSWAHRIAGLGMVGLAVLLAVETVRIMP